MSKMNAFYAQSGGVTAVIKHASTRIKSDASTLALTASSVPSPKS